MLAHEIIGYDKDICDTVFMCIRKTAEDCPGEELKVQDISAKTAIDCITVKNIFYYMLFMQDLQAELVQHLAMTEIKFHPSFDRKRKRADGSRHPDYFEILEERNWGTL